MILKLCRPDRAESDISVHKGGCFTFRTDLVSRYKLDEKNLSFSLDEEDKTNKYLYLSADPLINNAASFKIKKNSGQSYQKALKGLAKLLCAGAAKCQLIFIKTITYSGGGYMQFEVIREEIIRLPYQRENISLDKIHKSTEKGKRGPRGPYKKRQQVDHE